MAYAASAAVTVYPAPKEADLSRDSGTGAYGQALKELADAEHCAYLDMTTPWAEYIRSAKVHPHLFYRHVVRAKQRPFERGARGVQRLPQGEVCHRRLLLEGRLALP